MQKNARIPVIGWWERTKPWRPCLESELRISNLDFKSWFWHLYTSSWMCFTTFEVKYKTDILIWKTNFLMNFLVLGDVLKWWCCLNIIAYFNWNRMQVSLHLNDNILSEWIMAYFRMVSFFETVSQNWRILSFLDLLYLIFGY